MCKLKALARSLLGKLGGECAQCCRPNMEGALVSASAGNRLRATTPKGRRRRVYLLSGARGGARFPARDTSVAFISAQEIPRVRDARLLLLLLFCRIVRFPTRLPAFLLLPVLPVLLCDVPGAFPLARNSATTTPSSFFQRDLPCPRIDPLLPLRRPFYSCPRALDEWQWKDFLPPLFVFLPFSFFALKQGKSETCERRKKEFLPALSTNVRARVRLGRPISESSCQPDELSSTPRGPRRRF